MEPDHINAVFEFVGIIAGVHNVKALLRDKQVRGSAPGAVAFFTVWGVWNVFYYPFLLQPWSALAALGLVIVNSGWLLLAWRYR